MNILKRLVLCLIIGVAHVKSTYKYDLTIVGYIQPNDGLGTLPIELMNCLKDDISLNFIPTRDCTIKSLDSALKEIVEKALEDLKINPSDKAGRVAIYEELLTMPKKDLHTLVPENSFIKIAYTMFESTMLPQEWKAVANNYYDALVVPDVWLVEVYKRAGIEIPIFVLPIPLNLHRFINKTSKRHPREPFVFGTMAALEPRKNHKKLVESFYKAFGNSSKVRLLINARYPNKAIHKQLLEFIEEKKITNIVISIRDLTSASYINFMSSLDCYVSLSKGEGFAIPPRQALALGIPVLLTNNTAHTTLCKAGIVACIDSTIKEAAFSDLYYRRCGDYFNCLTEDAVIAMKDIIKNYKHYYDKAQKGKVWIQQYLSENLKEYYLALVKPQRVVLAAHDSIEPGCIYTTSSRLYDKYRKIIENNDL